MTRPTPDCPFMYELDDGYLEEDVGWYSVPTFYCKKTRDYCIFNTEDWDPGFHPCSHAGTDVLVTEK